MSWVCPFHRSQNSVLRNIRPPPGVFHQKGTEASCVSSLFSPVESFVDRILVPTRSERYDRSERDVPNDAMAETDRFDAPARRVPGGIKPNISNFGADQFDSRSRLGRTERENGGGFGWFFWDEVARRIEAQGPRHVEKPVSMNVL